MEVDARLNLSDSGSDSDATRVFDSDSDTSYDSQDDALSVESASTADGSIQPLRDAVVDLADDDDDETEFVILPAPRVAQPEPGSDSDESLPISLADEHASEEEDAVPAASTVSKKRKRLRQSIEPKPMKAAKIEKPTVIIKPQPTECTVCYDPCTNSGRHRLVSLKCGHVFGKKCIDRWVVERRTCPNCSLAVRKADIRPLFTDHVAVVDNSGVEDMAQKFEAEKSRRIQVETELSRAKLQLQFLQNEANRHQDEVAQWRKQVADMQCRLASERFTAAPVQAAPTPSQAAFSSQFSQFAGASSQQITTPTKPPTSQFAQPLNAMFSPPSTQATASQATIPSQVQIEKGSNYRVLVRHQLHNSRVHAISPSCSLMCVGEAFSSTSFGIVKLSTADTRHAVRIAVHHSPVRDLAISARDDLVLSVAFDGKLAVSNLRSDSVVMQYMLPPNKRNAWSCSFSHVDPFALFCGFHDGTIAKYDMRRPSAGAAPLALFELPVRQPVHSIQLCPAMGGQQELLVAGTFAGFGVWSSDKVLHPAPNGATTATTSFEAVAGCSSVSSAQTRRNRLLVTTRTQPQAASATHTIYDLPAMMTSMSGVAKRSTLTGFRTPQVISRSALWENREGAAMVASWDDEQKVVNVWDEASAQIQARLSPFGAFGNAAPVVDVQHSIAAGDWRRSRALLGVLSPQQLVLYNCNG